MDADPCKMSPANARHKISDAAGRDASLKESTTDGELNGGRGRPARAAAHPGAAVAAWGPGDDAAGDECTAARGKHAQPLTTASDALISGRGRTGSGEIDPTALPSKPSRRRLSASAYLAQFYTLAEQHALARFAAQYLHEEVRFLQSPNALDAKARDLTSFVAWFVRLNGHGDISLWQPRDTQAYLSALEHVERRAASTVNRAFATLRRFAKWVHERPGHVFERTGLPTRGIKPLAVDEPECKKLAQSDIHQLFKAADALVGSEGRKNARPRRNRAILSVLYYTGLRVSELVALRRDQYRGNYLVNVARKGKARSKGVYLVAECRRTLGDYLQVERIKDDPEGAAAPLFLASRSVGSKNFMTRQMAFLILQHIAQEASKHQKTAMAIHPHKLRHTFGANYRHKTGSDTETAAALGHTGLQHVGRYARQSNDEREAALEKMFER